MSTYIATDLHGHSCFSDAWVTPETYVDVRADHGLKVIALSDHDTVAGVARASKQAKARELTLVPAMETTSFVHFGTDAAEQVHVLAYFPPRMLDDGSLYETTLFRRSTLLHERWKAFVCEWLKTLPSPTREVLEADALEATEPMDFPGLQLIIHRIVERAEPLYRAFQKHHVQFWTEDAELFGWEPETMIEAIRADGALDVVAHPNRIRDKARMERVLEEVSGVEVYTSRHNQAVSARFRAFAEEKGKHWTASSDDHQHGAYFKPPMGTPKRTVDRILEGA
jgi:hypothetical protein